MPISIDPGQNYVCLVVDIQRNRPLGWIVPGGGNKHRWLSTITTTALVVRPAFTDTSTGRVMMHDLYFAAASDRNASGTAGATTYTLVGASMIV